MEVKQMDTERHKQVLERFDALLGAEDLTELDQLCTPDLVNHALAPDRPTGLAGTREFLQSHGRRSFADHAWHELVVVAEGAYVVQFGKRGGHWPGGPFLGIETPAGPYSRDFMAAYRFEAGRIAERWAIRDDLGMLRQLGALHQYDPGPGRI
jgi:predicted ester cyclase